MDAESLYYRLLRLGSVKSIVPCDVWFIEQFAVNVYLVLTHARLAYKADIPGDMNAIAIAEAKRLSGDRLLVIDDDEPLIALRSNKRFIFSILKEPMSYSSKMATLLGYRYIGDDFYFGERYMLHVNYGNDKGLYAYMVPKTAYTEELLEKVMEDEVRLTKALEPLGLGQVYTEVYELSS